MIGADVCQKRGWSLRPCFGYRRSLNAGTSISTASRLTEPVLAKPSESAGVSSPSADSASCRYPDHVTLCSPLSRPSPFPAEAPVEGGLSERGSLQVRPDEPSFDH